MLEIYRVNYFLRLTGYHSSQIGALSYGSFYVRGRETRLEEQSVHIFQSAGSLQVVLALGATGCRREAFC